MPTIIAEKKAFYAKHGIQSEHVLVPCAIATNALLSDDLDFAVCTGPGIAGAIKGLPIKLVMTTQDKLGYLLLVKANVQKLTDLRGKTIGISTFGSQLYLTSITLLRRYGMEPGKDINLIPGGDNTARLAAMDGGKVDAAFVSSPADIFGAKRGYKVLLWTRDHVPLLQNAMVTTDKQLKTAPDKVKRTIKASIEALRFIREQPEETINIAAKWLKLDLAITRAAFENYLPCYSADGALPDQALQDLIQYELDRGNLKKEIPLTQVASRALLQQAQKELICARTMNDSTTAAPLAGVRVLDFTHVLAGPFCTRLLADLGADVVRVESSKHPDHPWPSAHIGKDGRHASYLNTNRNKRSIAIDLKHPSGQQTAVNLAARADVVVENFSAGVMDRLGLGYETLRSRNQGIISVSMSGYGHDGPRRGWTSMNMNLQGYSGLMTVTGAEGDPPTAISNSWNDYIGGLHACFAIVQALDERGSSGIGTRLDLSQFECSVAMIAPLLLASAVTGRNPPRMGNRSARFAPQGVYRCAGTDNWCAISVRTEDQWRSLGRIIGKDSWAAQERFATVSGRQQCHDEIDEQLSTVDRTTFKPCSGADASRPAAFAPNGCGALMICSTNRMARRFFAQWRSRVSASMLTTGLPFRFSSWLFPSALSRPRARPAQRRGSARLVGPCRRRRFKSLDNQGALT